MTTSVKVEFTLPVDVREADDGGAYYVSVCPPLDVLSQGETEEAALANLAEALQLFIESCFERGTLEEVLKDCGFVPGRNNREVAEGERVVRVLLPLSHKPGEQGRADRLAHFCRDDAVRCVGL